MRGFSSRGDNLPFHTWEILTIRPTGGTQLVFLTRSEVRRQAPVYCTGRQLVSLVSFKRGDKDQPGGSRLGRERLTLGVIGPGVRNGRRFRRWVNPQWWRQLSTANCPLPPKPSRQDPGDDQRCYEDRGHVKVEAMFADEPIQPFENRVDQNDGV